MTRTRNAGAITFALVGFLILVELVSGILQGFYVPLIPDIVKHLDIRDGDFNWFEASQLLLSAIIVHLNDEHRWSREQIATWLESVNGKVNGVAAPPPAPPGGTPPEKPGPA